MPGEISRQYQGPKDGRVPSYMLRGGPGHDYPCNDPNVTECALWECQHKERCSLRVASEDRQTGSRE
jgi:hypothetical protein